jgi:hypothetical protein
MSHRLIRTKPYYKGVTRDFTSPTKKALALKYEPGSVVTADDFDKNADEDCAQGIHFVGSIAEALGWGPVVVEIRVPDGMTIVDSGTKLRAKTVEVGDVADLARANLARADLYGADLAGANLTGANLARANLTRADLSGANLIGANLYRADLTRADLTRANLTGADLTRADLYGANLTGANLYGAYLTGANLAGARGNDFTVLPSGWKVENGLIVRAS